MNAKQLENNPLKMYDVKDQLKRHVYERSMTAFAEGDEARDALGNKEQLQERQALMREKFIQAIGGLPPSDTPLNAQTTGVVECAGYKIEKVIFESRPKTYVTTNVYIPDGVTEPRGAVLFLCGHSAEAKQHPPYQVVCQYLVQAGLVVLAMDPLGQGERLGYYENALGEPTIRPGTGEHDYVGSQGLPLGHSLARYFLHDAMRAIDYLCTRPDVDPEKIGVTGCSGGGTQTSMMMVCDPRIAAAAPAAFIMNRRTYMFAGQAQDNEQIWPGMTALGFDHEDILMAMVPRPVRVLAVQYDFFPIEGTRATVARTKRFWDMYGQGHHLDLVEDADVHGYTEPLARAAAEFFAHHLLAKEGYQAKGESKVLASSQLWCTSSGQVRAAFADARGAHDEYSASLKKLAQERRSMSPAKRKERTMQWLREKVYAFRNSGDLNPRHVPIGHLDDLLVTSSIWWSQKDLLNHAYLFRQLDDKDQHLPLTIAVWNGGTTQLQAHMGWIRKECASGRVVMVLDVSGVGALAPHPFGGRDPLDFYGMVHKLADDLIWLGDSLAALRTYDVLRAIELAAQIPDVQSEDLRIYTHGRYSMYAQLAALLHERIDSVEVADGIEEVSEWVGARHYDSYDIMSIVFPGMLEHFDLDEIHS